MKYKIQKLKDFTVIRTGKLDSNAAVENGAYPFFTCDPQTLRINKWAYNTEAVLLAGNNASGNYTAKYYCGKFNAYQRTYIIETADSDRLNVRFLCYAINQQLRLLKTMSSGSTTKFLTIRMLHNLDIPCPEIEVQNRIVNVLGTIDDLIENNRKQIKLLEEAAQRLYKAWFVDLRFPGHEETPIVDGVPAGWERDKLGNYVVVKRGGSPRPIQEYLTDKGLNWLKISDATSSNGYYILDIKEHIVEAGLNKTVLLKKGSLVLSNSATPGIPRILDVDSCIHDGWLYFSESYFTNEFLFLLFIQERENLIVLGTGAVFTNLKTDIVKNYIITIPDKDVLVEFQEKIDPIFSSIKKKQNIIKKLSESRDRLLPKLMSGEIEV